MTKEQIGDLVATYQAGGTIRALTERFDISRSTVHDHLARSGVKRRNPKLTPDDIQEVAEHYCSGSSLATIGQHFRVDAHTVRRALAEAGVPIRPRRGRPPAR